jgi:DNA anti-recombination protein RmuC
MKRFLVFVLLVAVAVGALGYWRGWFNVTNDGKVAVHIDPAKFKKDKDAFSKTVGAKTKVMKDQVASLWKKTEGMTGDDKAQAQKELEELKQKHNRLELQLSELEVAGHDKFESIKQDLTKALDEVEKKIEELTKKLDKGKDK